MTLDTRALAERIEAGDRRALARAITLVESTRTDDRALAERLLSTIQPRAGGALRVGISGAPGVGKSTLIETIGRKLVDGELALVTVAQPAPVKVAVLAVDPSSPTTGGSLLGDKTRMEGLQRSANAYVRPQPAGRTLGGTAAHTGEALLLCEAAGFEVVLVETVGVGQSEHAVRDIVDTFVLLVPPGGGDDLQGIKRGVLELVDIVVVNKADGGRVEEAAKTRDAYAAGSRFFRSHAAPLPVLLTSAAEDQGVDALWAAIVGHREAIAPGLEARRAMQAERALWRNVEEILIEALRASPVVAEALPGLLAEVRGGRTSPNAAARALVRRLLSDAADG